MDFQGALDFLLALGSLEIHQAIPSNQAILSWSLEEVYNGVYSIVFLIFKPASSTWRWVPFTRDPSLHSL